MSTIGFGYGSEWHLLRYLGYHRDRLNRAVEAVIPGSRMIDWMTCRFEATPAAIEKDPPRFLDREFEGLDFLPTAERQRLAHAWNDYWPQTGNSPNWDAVGRIRVDGQDFWLIVEAKSHLGELRSRCGARSETEGGGRERILRAFEQTQAGLGIAVGAEAWLTPYYQFCNRIAFLKFLTDHGIPARLLFLYFLGDRFPPTRGAVCPGTEAGWIEALTAMYLHTGWTGDNALTSQVTRLFLQVVSAD